MEEPINKYYLIGGVILSLTVLVVILVMFVEIDPIQKSPAPTSQIGTGAQQGRNAFVKPAPPTPGNFIVTYQNIIDSNHKELHALSCGDGSCTSISSTALNALSGINVADQQAIAIGVDGFPIIAYRYYDGFARTLNVIHCTDKKCNSFAEIFWVSNQGFLCSIPWGNNKKIFFCLAEGKNRSWAPKTFCMSQTSISKK